MGPKKGTKLYHNMVTRVTRGFLQDPGEPWVLGRGPDFKQVITPESNLKRSQTHKRRLEEFGPTEKELEGYKKTSETRKRLCIKHTPEVVEGIKEKLRGQFQPWRDNKSRSSCRRCNCDTVYILKVTTKEGEVFGKWGSSSEKSFQHREKEFKRKGFTYEVVYWNYFGERTEDTESYLGQNLSQHPWDHPTVHFFGHTETFVWSPTTEHLLKELIYVLEESPTP